MRSPSPSTSRKQSSARSTLPSSSFPPSTPPGTQNGDHFTHFSPCFFGTAEELLGVLAVPWEHESSATNKWPRVETSSHRSRTGPRRLLARLSIGRPRPGGA